jgi:hypothetical protein
MGFPADHCDVCTKIGQAWSSFDESVEAWLQQRWDVLLQHGDEPVVALRDYDKFPHLITALFQLLAAADEASVGVGFGGTSDMAHLARFFAHTKGPASLCNRVAEEEACVQPKGRTPTVGCNLRSMSQHLALVPPSTQVTTTHLEAQEPFDLEGPRHLGVLLVPFPYRIATDDFQEQPQVGGHPWARLMLRCSWHETPVAELVAFVKALITAGELQGRTTDVIVFPELALTPQMWDALIKIDGPRLFVGCVLKPQSGDAPPLNLARGHFVEKSPFQMGAGEASSLAR